MKARLVVFHCAHLSPYILASASASADQLARFTREDEAYKLKKLIAQVNKAFISNGIKKIPATTRFVVESNPLLVDNINEVAANNHADLIVMGTHGASGLNRFFFGSNTATLISRSNIPVLAVPDKYRFRKIRDIAYSSDLEDFEEELNRLLPFAKAVKASIDIIYLDYGDDEKLEQVKNASGRIGKMRYKKIKLIRQKATIEFSLNRQLKKILSKKSYQWLVMFTKDRGFWDKIIFGGKSESMSYALKIPLLTFRKGM
jgi:nucleotide-binding universal stress UspA family protein